MRHFYINMRHYFSTRLFDVGFGIVQGLDCWINVCIVCGNILLEVQLGLPAKFSGERRAEECKTLKSKLVTDRSYSELSRVEDHLSILHNFTKILEELSWLLSLFNFRYLYELQYNCTLSAMYYACGKNLLVYCYF